MSTVIGPTSHVAPAHSVTPSQVRRESSPAASVAAPPAPSREGTGRIIDAHA